MASHRAGYRPAERRELEQGLREWKMRLVASRCALELGVDVGGLDAVVLVGYPRSIASAWQQAGRGTPHLVLMLRWLPTLCAIPALWKRESADG